MKVLHLYSGNLYGGVERMLVTWARERNRCEPMTPAFALSYDGPLANELRSAGCAPTILGAVRFSRPWTVLRARGALRRLLASAGIDVAVTHAPWSQAVYGPVLRRRRIPHAMYAHDIATGTHWIERLAARTPPNLVIANSRFTAESNRALFPTVPQSILHPLVPQFPQLPEAERMAIRAEFDTPPDAVVTVQASRFEAWKGHEAHLAALRELRDLPNWIAWLVGAPQRPHEQAHYERMRRLAETSGIGDRVRFVGKRDDVPRVLRAADVYCQPNSSPEPFGLAFVEALGAGLPVVTTDTGGNSDVVSPECGIVVPLAAPGALAAALRRLVIDAGYRARLGTHGPARARELSDVTARIRDLYETARQLESRRA